MSNVNDFITAYGNWENSQVTGECYLTSVTTGNGEEISVYAKPGCSSIYKNSNKVYLNYYTDSSCTQDASSGWYSGSGTISVAPRDIRNVQKFKNMGTQWFSFKHCESCVNSNTGYDICDEALCGEVMECTKWSDCYSR